MEGWTDPAGFSPNILQTWEPEKEFLHPGGRAPPGEERRGAVTGPCMKSMKKLYLLPTVWDFVTLPCIFFLVSKTPPWLSRQPFDSQYEPEKPRAEFSSTRLVALSSSAASDPLSASLTGRG